MIELWLERRRIAHERKDTLALTCESLSISPEEDVPLDVPVDGGNRPSVKKPAAVLTIGLSPKVLQSIHWEPTHLSFRDSETGEQRGFAVHGYTFGEPDSAKFLVDHELA